MASGTIPLSKLIQCSLAIEAVREDGDWFITYRPNGTTEYKIKLNAASITLLKQKRDQMLTFLNQNVTLTGEIVSTSTLQDIVIPASTIQRWV